MVQPHLVSVAGERQTYEHVCVPVFTVVLMYVWRA